LPPPPRPPDVPDVVVGRPGDTLRVSESRRWGARECTGTKKNLFFCVSVRARERKKKYKIIFFYIKKKKFKKENTPEHKMF
jgi:hypothetical protein